MNRKHLMIMGMAWTLAASLLLACGPGGGSEERRRPAREGYIPPSRAIHHPDWRRRKDAVDVLAEARDNRSLALLSIALRDKDARVRVAAIKALAGRKDRSSLGAIAKAIQDPDERVRIAALEGLRALTGIQAVSIALHRLGSGSAAERKAVVDCLADQLRNDRSSARSKLIKRLVIMVKAERPQTQKDAAAVLEKIGEVATYTMLNALAAARPGSRGKWMRRLESILLKVGRPALKSLVQAVQYAQDGEAQARAAVAPLVRIGKPAVPSLVKLLDWRKKYSHLTGMLATQTLQRIGRDAVPAVLPLLKDKRADRRLTGAHLLGKLGGKAAVDGLLALLETEKTPAVLSAAVRMLGDLKDKRAVKPILAALARDTDPTPTSARYSAYRLALWHLVPGATTLNGALKSPQIQVRLVAAQVAGLTKAAGTLDALLGLVTDKSTAVVAATAYALGELEDAKAEKELRNLTRHKDLTVRFHAVSALGRIGNKGAYFAINAAGRKRDIVLKMAAALAVGRIGDKRGKKLVRRLGRMPYTSAKAAAKWARKRIRHKATTRKEAPTVCGLITEHQLQCFKTHPAVIGYGLGEACAFGNVEDWEPLLKVEGCDQLVRAAERFGAKDRGVVLESWWDAAKKKRYQKVVLWAGMPHGRVQRWYPNGQPMLEGNNRMGNRWGQWTAFYDNGKQRWQAFFAFGNKISAWKRWYADGVVREQGTLDSVGKRMGTWTEFHENGQKAMVLTYVGGKMEGKQVSYYDNGVMSGEAFYKDGRRQGSWKTWYPSKAKRSEGTYAAGQRTGAWKWWYRDGKKREEGSFVKGVKSGIWKSYDKQGVLVETCRYAVSGTPQCSK